METILLDPKTITAEILAAGLLKAKAAALAADPGQGNDGGSCNLDSPTIRLRGVRQSVIDAAVAASGVEIERPMTGGFWGGRRFVRTPEHGQADRRSTMAQAACKSLREDGFDTLMFMQSD